MATVELRAYGKSVDVSEIEASKAHRAVETFKRDARWTVFEDNSLGVFTCVSSNGQTQIIYRDVAGAQAAAKAAADAKRAEIGLGPVEIETPNAAGTCELCGDAANPNYGNICDDCIRDQREARIVASGRVWCEKCESAGVIYAPSIYGGMSRTFCTCEHGKDAERCDRFNDEAEAREYRRLARMGIII